MRLSSIGGSSPAGGVGAVLAEEADLTCWRKACAWNWFDDRTIRTCAWISGVSGVLFLDRSLTFANLVVNLRAFGNRNFAIGCALSFLTGIGVSPRST